MGPLLVAFAARIPLPIVRSFKIGRAPHLASRRPRVVKEMSVRVRRITDAYGQLAVAELKQVSDPVRKQFAEVKNWRTIRLELAWAPEFPNGSVSRAFLLRLPLDDNDLVDEPALKRAPQLGTVRRHWSNSPDEKGFLQKVDGHLVLDCEGTEARMLRLDGHPIRLGQELPITEPDGNQMIFRISSIR